MNRILGAMLMGMILGVISCSNSSTATNKDAGSTTSDASGTPTEKASKALSTTMTGEVALTSGAKLLIPYGAVPEGNYFEFTAERYNQKPTPPEGDTAASDIYAFGPGNITFARPVQVVIPVSGSPKAEEVRIYRINPKTKKLEKYSGTYDATTKTVTALTFELSPWFAATGSAGGDQASGAFKITNTSSDSWINVCAKNLTPKYTGAEKPSVPVSAAPMNTTGWSSTIHWYVPQGTYTLCVESQKAGTVSTPPGKPQHVIEENVVVDKPWTSSNPQTKDLSYGALSNPVDGACDCTPTASKANRIFYNGNIGGVSSKPTAPTEFTTDKCYFVLLITDYHYFNNGKLPGTIGLKRKSDGKMFGPWNASGQPGQGGVQNAYWNVYPSINLPAGSYEVIDSDPDTWSHNSESENRGMSWVEAVPGDC